MNIYYYVNNFFILRNKFINLVSEISNSQYITNFNENFNIISYEEFILNNQNNICNYDKKIINIQNQKKEIINKLIELDLNKLKNISLELNIYGKINLYDYIMLKIFQLDNNIFNEKIFLNEYKNKQILKNKVNEYLQKNRKKIENYEDSKFLWNFIIIYSKYIYQRYIIEKKENQNNIELYILFYIYNVPFGYLENEKKHVKELIWINKEYDTNILSKIKNNIKNIIDKEDDEEILSKFNSIKMELDELSEIKKFDLFEINLIQLNDTLKISGIDTLWFDIISVIQKFRISDE